MLVGHQAQGESTIAKLLASFWDVSSQSDTMVALDIHGC